MDQSLINDEIDRRLNKARPATPEVDRQLVEKFLAQATETKRHSRARSWSILALVSCIAGGILAAPMAAVALRAFDAQTGVFNPAEPAVALSGSNQDELSAKLEQPEATSSEAAPGAEWINMGASDVEQYMASIAPVDLPLPAGVTWSEVIDGFLEKFSSEEYVASNQLGGASGVSAESLVIDIMWEYEARRTWMRDWLTAYEDNDTQRMQIAGIALSQSVDWPAEQQSTGGESAEEIRKWMLVIGDGNYDAAQAYAHQNIWTDLWDGIDRSELRGEFLSGRFWATTTEVE